jgi:hypothetical protein
MLAHIINTNRRKRMSHIRETAVLEEQIEALIKRAGESLRQQVRRTARLTYPDFAEALQTRIRDDLEAEKMAHAPRKHPNQDGHDIVRLLEAHIATLEGSVAKAEALSEHRRQEAQTATKRADDLVAELIEMTSEVVEMSRRMTEQTAETNKLRPEISDYRLRSRRWQSAG